MSDHDIRGRAREALDRIGKLAYFDGSRWVVQESNQCTCQGPCEPYWAHQPGCGYEPIGQADNTVGELVCTTAELARELVDALESAHAELDDAQREVERLRAALADRHIITDHFFQPVAGHPDDDECTHRSDVSDETYCGQPESDHAWSDR